MTESGLEPVPVRLLLRVPVEPVGVEGLVALVVHEGLVGDEQAMSRGHDAPAQVVVLVPADAVGGVESTQLLEHLPADRQAEADQPLVSPTSGTRWSWAQSRANRRMPATSPRRYAAPSATWGPDTKFDRGPVAPTVGSSSNGTIRGSSQWPVRTVSLFRKTRMSLRASGRAVVAPRGETPVLRVGHHVDPRIPAKPPRGDVGRPVVHDHHLVADAQRGAQ